MTHKSRFLNWIIFVFVLTVGSLNIGRSFAGELTVQPAITASTSLISREFDGTSQTSSALTLAPSLSTIYSGNHASLSMLLKHTTIAREEENGNSTANYNDINLASRIELISNLLKLELNAGQTYRARNESQFYFSDRLSEPDDLTKIQTDKALLSFAIPNAPYIAVNWQASLSHTNTDRDADERGGIDGKNVLLAANLFQGRKVQNYSYSFSAQHNNTSRGNAVDFKSTNAVGQVGVGISDDFSLIAQGRLDDYNSESLNFNSSRLNLDTESYGAGIRWQPRDGRTIELTFNQLNQIDETSEFVGVSTQWAFSNRTSMSFDYGKRFYGNAYSFNFDYNTRSLRALVSYSEDVTTFARLNPTSQDVGIFVCSFGSSDLADCFQPDSLDYLLQPGEEFRSLTEISSDITDEIIFRKNGNIGIGYAKRKLLASLNITHGTTEYLESARETTRSSVSLNMVYKLGKRSNIDFTTSISEQTSNGENNKTETFLSSLAFVRTFKQNLTGTMSLRYAKRNINESSQDFTNTSLTASLAYQF